MNDIKEIVNMLNKEDESWLKYLEKEGSPLTGGDKDSCPDVILKMLKKLLFSIQNKQKRFIDERDGDGEQDFHNEVEAILGKSITKRIWKINSSIVEIYRNIRPLREAHENTIPLITSVFERVSVSYEPDYTENCETYGIESEEEFETLVLQLDRIVAVHVSRHYDKQTAQREFIKMSGLDKQYGFVYAELYEKYLEKLQHNICLEKLEDLGEQMEDLNKQIADLTRQISNMYDVLKH